MVKKYAVSIMDRHYLGDGFFLFSVNHTELGTIDEKTGLFKDRNGVEYAPMLAPNMMQTEIPYAYCNAIELEKLPEALGMDSSLREAISEFDYQSKRVIFVVSKTQDGQPFCVRFNMDDMKNSAEEGIKQMGGSISEQQERDDAHQAREQEYDEVQSSMEMLKERIKRGDFDKAELQEILDYYELSLDKMSEVISVIDKQLGRKPLPDKKKQPNKQPQKKTTSKEPVAEEKINIDALHKKVIESLIAQDEPARRVITELARKDMNKKKKKQGLLLTGPTGVGKTYLMSLIAEQLNKPFIKIDATQITIPGYTGKDIEEKLWELYEKSGRSKERTEQAIVFFDEIDKKGSDKKSDVSGQGVLNVLLPFIEGSTYDATPNVQMKTKTVPINTANMTIVFGGAFSDVYKNLKVQNQMGFGGTVNSDSKPKYRRATTKDFVEKAQMTDEFMGRVTVIKLNDLDVEDIKRVMLESKESALKVQEDIFRQLGVKITFTPGFVEKVAQNAFDKKSGARGIDSVVDDCTWKAFDEVYSHPDEYEEVIVDEKTIESPENFQLVKRKRNQS